MQWFNKSRKIKDERLISMMNKIYRETYILVILIVLMAIGVKYFVYGLDVGRVISEMAVLVLSSIYYLARRVQLGLYADEIELHDRTSKLPMNIKNIIIGLMGGVMIALFFGVRSAVVYGNETNRLWYFILVFFASFMIYVPFFVSIIAITDGISRKVSRKAHQKEQDQDQ